jgi:NADH-quinone oxidoreductase subunit F
MHAMVATSRLLGSSLIADLDEYCARREGGHGLRAARHRSPEELRAVVARAGLRGRGGAGFPTGRKWSTVAAGASAPFTVVVNAAEGEPGTFKDRMLLREDPYLVLEGARIAALAVGAREIVVALKAAFVNELDRVREAAAEMREAGWLDDVSFRTVEGPGEYLFGEETALLEVIEGRPPFPRVVPPYRRGLEGAGPTLVDNVETLANVPGILRHGADWNRELGTPQSPGSIVCTVTGDVTRHGVAEFAMGTPLREIVETIGGAVPESATVLPGVSAPPLAAEQLDVPATYEDLVAAGSGLGSAGFIVIGPETSLRAVAAGVARFLSVESCGQCRPCKHDGVAIADALAEGDGADVRRLLGAVGRGARCALAGQVERVVGGLLDLADARGDEPSTIVYPVEPLVDIVGGRAVHDTAQTSKRPDWSYEGEGDSHHDPVERFADSRVMVHEPRVRERDATREDHPLAPAGESEGIEPFAPLHRSHDRITATMDELRSVAPGERSAIVDRLRDQLGRHRDAVERYVYPLLERIDPAEGADIAWYPMHHDHEAARLVDRLQATDPSAAPGLLDDICADVNATIIEIDRAVLPRLASALGDAEQLRLVDAGLRDSLGEV